MAEPKRCGHEAPGPLGTGLYCSRLVDHDGMHTNGGWRWEPDPDPERHEPSACCGSEITATDGPVHVCAMPAGHNVHLLHLCQCGYTWDEESADDRENLPKRMADAIRRAAHDCDDGCEVVGCHPNIAASYTSAGGTIIEVEGTPEALAETVMPVRDGATAHIVARLAEAERKLAEAGATIERARRLQELTIAASCRVEAINQARDTLAAMDGGR